MSTSDKLYMINCHALVLVESGAAPDQFVNIQQLYPNIKIEEVENLNPKATAT